MKPGPFPFSLPLLQRQGIAHIGVAGPALVPAERVAAEIRRRRPVQEAQ